MAEITKKEIIALLKDNATLLEMRAADIRQHIDKNELIDAHAWLTRTRDVINQMVDDINTYFDKKLSDD